MSKPLLSAKIQRHQKSQLQIRYFCHQKKKKCWYFFLFLHKNTCCGYSLEVPQWRTSNEYPQHMFLRRNKKIFSWYSLLSGTMKDSFFFQVHKPWKIPFFSSTQAMKDTLFFKYTSYERYPFLPSTQSMKDLRYPFFQVHKPDFRRCRTFAKGVRIYTGGLIWTFL